MKQPSLSTKKKLGILVLGVFACLFALLSFYSWWALLIANSRADDYYDGDQIQPVYDLAGSIIALPIAIMSTVMTLLFVVIIYPIILSSKSKR